MSSATSTRRTTPGTFTFSDIEAFDAGLPTSFTQRNGEVNTKFNQYQLGAYWQDDIRLNNKFSVSVGVRNEMQSHIDDKLNLMPRLGFTATPWGSRTAIRGGYGLFYDWYSSNLYDQTLRVNGVSVRDLLILNPGYPDPLNGTEAQILPRGRIQASSGSEHAAGPSGIDRRRAAAHSEPQRPDHLSDASRPPSDSLDQHQRARTRSATGRTRPSAPSRSSSPRDGPIPIA